MEIIIYMYLPVCKKLIPKKPNNIVEPSAKMCGISKVFLLWWHASIWLHQSNRISCDGFIYRLSVMIL